MVNSTVDQFFQFYMIYVRKIMTEIIFLVKSNINYYHKEVLLIVSSKAY